MEEKLFTTEEAARYLRYSVSALQSSRMTEGKLGGKSPPPHLGRHKGIRYLRSELDKWMRSE